MNASRGWRGAAAGAAAAVLGAGAGELVAAVVAPTSSPFAVIGGALIDVAPSWAKDAAIAWFGTSDKFALLTAIGIVLLILGAAAGICEARRPLLIPPRQTACRIFVAQKSQVAGDTPSTPDIFLLPAVGQSPGRLLPEYRKR